MVFLTDGGGSPTVDPHRNNGALVLSRSSHMMLYKITFLCYRYRRKSDLHNVCMCLHVFLTVLSASVCVCLCAYHFLHENVKWNKMELLLSVVAACVIMLENCAISGYDQNLQHTRVHQHQWGRKCTCGSKSSNNTRLKCL